MTRSVWMPRRGDINGLFGLLVDNAAALVLLYTLLSAPGYRVDRFSPAFVLTWMIPGTVAGVLLGAVLYSFMALRLSKRTGRDDVTAMPIGLDTPSVFAMVMVVLLPALAEGRKLFANRGLSELDLHHLASAYAWHVGVAVLLMLGLFKIVAAPFGLLVRRLFPRAAMLGSLAAISLVLMAFLPLARHVAPDPLVGIPVLVLILATLFSGRATPGRIPGAVLALGFGFVIVLVCAILGERFGWRLVALPDSSLLRPRPLAALPGEVWSEDWWREVFQSALYKMPMALPFAIFTVIGGVQCSESAAAAGDDYSTSGVLVVQGLATTAAGLLGGVVQSTPYFGHPAYKQMGAGWSYAMLGTVVLAVLGYFGWFAGFFQTAPGAIFFPLIIFVGLRTIAHSFQATRPRDYAAMALAAVPVLAYVIVITTDELFMGPKHGQHAAALVQALRCLGSGFILTGMLWAAAAVAMLDGKPMFAIPPLLIASLCALFGLIHSPLPDAPMAMPNDVWSYLHESPNPQLQFQSPFHWAAAYLLACGVLLVDRLVGGRPEPAPATEIPAAEGK